MSEQPNVVAVMLTRGERPEYARRAIECFHRQTYPEANRWLLIFDTGDSWPEYGDLQLHRVVTRLDNSRSLTVGELRNEANAYTSIIGASNNARGFKSPDVLIHWDDDDWSHAERISEQVKLLVSSGADCVGYREMLFWKHAHSCMNPVCEEVGFHSSVCKGKAEAWLYSSGNRKYAIGTSLCYWRKAWERNQFPPLPKAKGATGEDTEFLRALFVLGERCSALHDGVSEPRMIARIHPGNTQYYGRDHLEASASWSRVPEWDEACRQEME